MPATVPSVETLSKQILYLLINEQGLRAGDGMDPAVLAHDLTRHEIPLEEQQPALQFAKDHGWLRDGPYGEVQLTERGFSVS